MPPKEKKRILGTRSSKSVVTNQCTSRPAKQRTTRNQIEKQLKKKKQTGDQKSITTEEIFPFPSFPSFFVLQRLTRKMKEPLTRTLFVHSEKESAENKEKRLLELERTNKNETAKEKRNSNHKHKARKGARVCLRSDKSKLAKRVSRLFSLFCHSFSYIFL